ncbi:MAG: DUF6920 family protein [Bacteriovoracaceae bacterium]
MNFENRVKLLFELSIPINTNSFSYSQIKGLPEPVQRYFRFALTEGQNNIHSVRLIHDGHFKTNLNANWTDIKGEQYFTASPPGFVWKGSTKFFQAQDMYIKDNGRLMVFLLSFLKIVDGHGLEYDQGELSRWLAENVWFPTNLLPSQNLSWSAIDNFHSKLIYNHHGIQLLFYVEINKIGEIVQIETKRYMDKEKLETWVIRLSEYKTMNNIKVPTKISASWQIESGEFTYARFNILKMEYDKNKSFAESPL